MPSAALRTSIVLSAVLVAGALASSRASAAVLLTDDFESYPAQSAPNAAFDAAWPITVAATASTTPVAPAITSFITAGNGTNTTQVVSFPANGTGVVGRRVRSFANTVPTASAPVAFSFDFYDAAPTASYRQYAEILANDESNANAVTQLIAIGEANSATGAITTPGGTAGTYATSKYQARVAFGTGAGYFNLQATRTLGWHNFKVVIDGTKYDFYVDGTLDTSFTNTAGTVGASVGYDQIRMSSGLSSASGGAFFDNVLVQTVVPEPTTLAAIAGVATLGLVRRRRA